LKIFFWNTCGRNIDEILVNVIRKMNIDFIVLAEFNEENSDFLHIINREKETFESVVNGHLKVSHLRSKKMSHTDSFYNPPLSLLPTLPFNL